MLEYLKSLIPILSAFLLYSCGNGEKSDALALMVRWADAMVDRQIEATGDPALDGNFFCEVCDTLHGRTIDLVWPLVWLWDRTGKDKYLDAAMKVTKWGEDNLQQEDGSYLNDLGGGWKGITEFSQVSIGKTLLRFGDRLPDAYRNQLERLFWKQTEYLVSWMAQPEMVVNVNYRAAHPLAMQLAYRLSGDTRYLESGHEQVDRVVACIASDGLLFGEAKPMDIRSKRGHLGVDIGYNVEETLPSMLEYAEMAGDTLLLNHLIHVARTHLDFILPDGGLDNSFGARSCKWSYWGSRTSDGILPMLAVMARYGYPEAVKVARLTLDLYRRLTDAEGLLTGGLYYEAAGEPTCIHHTFCHLKSLPAWIETEDSLPEASGEKLLSETAFGHRYYPTNGVHLVGIGPWRATVNENDYYFTEDDGKSTGGGSLTMLYHHCFGLVCAATMGSYSIVEVNNMQHQRGDDSTRCLTPRLERDRWSSIYDDDVRVTTDISRDSICLHASGVLTDICDERGGGAFSIRYRFSEDVVDIALSSDNNASFFLPIIAGPDDVLHWTGHGASVCRDSICLFITTDGILDFIPSGRPDRLMFHPVAGLMAACFSVSVPAGEVRHIYLSVTSSSGVADIPSVLVLHDASLPSSATELKLALADKLAVYRAPDTTAIRVERVADIHGSLRLLRRLGRQYRTWLVCCDGSPDDHSTVSRIEALSKKCKAGLLWYISGCGDMLPITSTRVDYSGFLEEQGRLYPSRIPGFVGESFSQWWTGMAGENRSILRIPLWDGNPPHYEATYPELINRYGRIDSISIPELEVFLPHQSKLSPALVFIPGGGLSYTGFLRNAREAAETLLPRGVAVIGVKYRVKRGEDIAFEDVSMAIRQIRSHAAEWNIDPESIIVAGQSAGALLTLRLLSGSDQGMADTLQAFSSRPDYAAVLTAWSYGGTVCPYDFGKDTPSTLIMHARDENCFSLAKDVASRLRSSGVPLQTYFVPDGGHGAFEIQGLGGGHEWPEVLLGWLCSERARQEINKP